MFYDLFYCTSILINAFCGFENMFCFTNKSGIVWLLSTEENVLSVVSNVVTCDNTIYVAPRGSSEHENTGYFIRDEYSAVKVCPSS
jgi:hypothetical protein